MQSNEWFKHCSDEFQSTLVSMGQIRHLRDGEVLKEEGKTASGLWCVLAGRGRVHHTVGNKTQLVRDYMPYDWMGEVSLIDNVPSSLSMAAFGETTLMEIDRDALLQWLEECPIYWRDFARLAVMLPRPKYFETRPNSGYLSSRASTIAARMGGVELP